MDPMVSWTQAMASLLEPRMNGIQPIFWQKDFMPTLRAHPPDYPGFHTLSKRSKPPYQVPGVTVNRLAEKSTFSVGKIGWIHCARVDQLLVLGMVIPPLIV